MRVYLRIFPCIINLIFNYFILKYRLYKYKFKRKNLGFRQRLNQINVVILTVTNINFKTVSLF